MDRPARIRAARRIHVRARALRGRFLHAVAALEHDVAAFLTAYFCTDRTKQELFFKRVVGGRFFSLESKRAVLMEIVKRDYPGYLDREPNREVLGYMQGIEEFRNKLAHSIPDLSNAALARPLDQGIGFVEWKDGTPITETEFQEWIAKVNMVRTCLTELNRLLPFKWQRQIDIRD